MSKQIGVLGCGWLGTPLALRLIQKGFQVRGSTTRTEKVTALKKSGIEASKIRLGESEIEGEIKSFLKGLDCLILNIPPGLRANPQGDFVAIIQLLEAHLLEAGIPHLIFVSSTSVYGNTSGEVCETNLPLPESETGKQLVAVENLLLANTSRKTQIVRPGGLLGPDRHPVFTLSGRSFHSGGNDRVNLIRLEDLLNILGLLISTGSESGTYNAVYPDHPTKRDFYTREASYFGIAPPSYSGLPEPPKGKKVLCPALQALGYRFSQSIWTTALHSGSGDPQKSTE